MMNLVLQERCCRHCLCEFCPGRLHKYDCRPCFKVICPPQEVLNAAKKTPWKRSSIVLRPLAVSV